MFAFVIKLNKNYESYINKSLWGNGLSHGRDLNSSALAIKFLTETARKHGYRLSWVWV